MNKIKIVCDSLSDVTDQQIEKYDIEFIPLNIIIGDNEYKDRQDISIDNFYSIIRNDKVIPKTSQATYADFYRVFEKYTQEGYDILYISVSPNATGTYQSAVLASQEFEGHNIKIIDSNSLCYGIGYQVLMACELREDGKSLDEIVDYIESIKNRVYATFFCDDLEYLSKGGRISGTKAMIGSVLGIKPICVVKDGLVENVAVPRGKKNIAHKLIETAKENGVTDFKQQRIFIGYSDDIKERDRLVEVLTKDFGAQHIEYFRIGCGIGTHGGPGTTGFICLKG